MNIKTKAAISLFLSTLFGASIAIVIKIALHNIGPFTILFLRFFFASLCLFPFVIKGKPWRSKQFHKLLAVSVFSTINTALFVWGIQYTSASVSQILYAAMPLLIILLSHFLWKEKTSTHKIVGVLVGLIGIFYIVYLSFVEKGTTITGSMKGNIAVLAAMCSWMMYILYSKRISKDFSPLTISGVNVVTSLGIATVLFLIELSHSSFSLSFLQPQVLLSGMWLGIVGSAFFYITYQYGIKHTSALTASLTSYLQPIVTTLLAVVFLAETLTSGFIIGSILVLLGIFITTTFEYYHSKKRKSSLAK